MRVCENSLTSCINISHFSSKSCTNGMYIYINIYMCVCVREWCYIPHHILAYQYGKKCSNMKRDVVITLCATECKYGTGWRRLIGCLKLQIIFHKRATSHRALLRKMTYKDKACYASSPPSICIRTYTHTYIHAYMHTYMHTCVHAFTALLIPSPSKRRSVR